MTIAERTKILKNAVGGGLLAGLLLSIRLWAGGRTYPEVPLLPGLPTSPGWIEGLLFLVMLAIVCAIIAAKEPRRPAFAFLILAALMVVFDQSRLQPWFYVYCFLLLCLTGAITELDAARIAVAGTYLWSGLQKLNGTFTGQIFPWFVSPMTGGATASTALAAAAIVVALAEASIGAGLLTRRFRRPALIGVVVMHGLILIALGPWGRGWNPVVWPWNIAMPIIALALFAESKEPRPLQPPWTWRKILATALFLCAPALSFLGFWDSYLSSSLYSGATSTAVITVRHDHVTDIVDLNAWSLRELDVPAYPEPRVFLSALARVCATAAEPKNVTLVIQERPTLFLGSAVRTFGCEDVR